MDPLSQLETLTSFCHKVDRANRHKISKDMGDLNTVNQLDTHPAEEFKLTMNSQKSEHAACCKIQQASLKEENLYISLRPK